MEIQEIKAGIIISGPKWPEPVEIKKVDYSIAHFLDKDLDVWFSSQLLGQMMGLSILIVVGILAP